MYAMCKQILLIHTYRMHMYSPPPLEKNSTPPPRIVCFTATFSNHPLSKVLLDPGGLCVAILLSLLLLLLHACASFARCLGAVSRACLCMCVCKGARECVCVCVCACVRLCMCVCACVCLCACVRLCVCLCMCVCVRVCVCVCVQASVCTLCACAFLLLHEHACIPVSTSFVAECSADAIPIIQSWGQTKVYSAAWLPLFLALLCLSLSPVCSCLLQAGGVWGAGAGGARGGEHPGRLTKYYSPPPPQNSEPFPWK